MDDLAHMLKKANDAAMSENEEWRKTVDRVRTFVGDGSDRGFRATYFLGVLMGASQEGQMKMDDAMKMALVLVEMSPPERGWVIPG
jgi:hypothetical protein